MNGTMKNGHQPENEKVIATNGFHYEEERQKHDSEPSLEELERELPVVYDGQVPLGDLLSRVVQSIYAELSELAETYVHIPLTRVWLRIGMQDAEHVRRSAEEGTGRLGRQDKETGCKDVCRGQVGPRCGYRPEVHGAVLESSNH